MTIDTILAEVFAAAKPLKPYELVCTKEARDGLIMITRHKARGTMLAVPLKFKDQLEGDPFAVIPDRVTRAWASVKSDYGAN